MTRTTIALDDDLLRRLKRLAAREERTLQDVVNELLRKALAPRRGPAYSLSFGGWRADVLPGIDPADREDLLGIPGGGRS